jgi:hypothetical protein
MKLDYPFIFNQNIMKYLPSLILFTFFIFLISLNAQQTDSVLTTDNGIIKLKLDLTRGGAISYISSSGSTVNLVNIHDEGRYIQQSYYAGTPVNRQVDGQSPAWSPWSWNPIQVGDSYNNRAKILSYWQHGDTLYTKCIPMQWDMDNMPAQAVMEQWNILDSNAIKVHCKLTCERTDSIYAENVADDQELPAVYPISSLDNLFTYTGNSPFTGDSLNNLPVVNLSSGFWGRYGNVSEHWMAFVDSSKWGMGVFNQNCVNFIAGMAGSPGGQALDNSTSYIAPVKQVILNKNSVYEYNYDIIIGTVDQIRQYVYKVGYADTTISVAEWNFDTGLNGWSLAHSLSGTVTDSSLTLNLTGADPYMVSPDNLNINASLYKYLSFTMKNNTPQTTAGFFWATNTSPNFSAGLSLPSIPLVPNDSVFRTYIIDISNDTAWTGTINQIRLDPVQGGSSGSIELKQIKLLRSISYVHEDQSAILKSFSLSQNYPNPFNSTTTIRYSINSPGIVTLRVYNMLGQEVSTLVNKGQNVGSHNVVFDASKLASGVYFYRLSSGTNTAIKKLMLIK